MKTCCLSLPKRTVCVHESCAILIGRTYVRAKAGGRMRKLLSLRHWRSTFALIFRVLRSKDVSLADKLLFGVPVLVYWVMPDALPMLPVDDIAVTMIIAEWFARRMEKKYNIS